jgi:hypothetical protein
MKSQEFNVILQMRIIIGAGIAIIIVIIVVSIVKGTHKG